MVSSGLSAGAGLRRCLAVFAGVVLQRRGWVTTVVLLWISNAQISNPMSSRRDLTKKDPGSCVFAFMLGFGDMVFHNKSPEMLMWHRDWELPVESAATPQKITYVMNVPTYTRPNVSSLDASVSVIRVHVTHSGVGLGSSCSEFKTSLIQWPQ